MGIPYWLVPYNKVSLPDTLLGPGLLVVAVSALLLCLRGVASFWRPRRRLVPSRESL